MSVFRLFPELLDCSREEFYELAAARGLAMLPMVLSLGETPAEHLASFRRECEVGAAGGAELIVAHAGADWFDDTVAARFLTDCVRIGREFGLRPAFETHRGRILFTPWRTLRLLQQVDDLWLNADFSHFVCVAERLLEDRSGLMETLAARSIHIHQRVGFENGPQVPDPRDQRWAAHLAAHERWWDAVWAAAAARGDASVSLTPEYGPPTYAPVGQDPETRWEICEWTTDRARRRFAGMSGTDMDRS